MISFFFSYFQFKRLSRISNVIDFADFAWKRFTIHICLHIADYYFCGTSEESAVLRYCFFFSLTEMTANSNFRKNHKKSIFSWNEIDTIINEEKNLVKWIEKTGLQLQSFKHKLWHVAFIFIYSRNQIF